MARSSAIDAIVYMRKCWLWILLVLATATSLVAQQYPFLAVPGAPKGVLTMMQDKGSAIWMGTDDGVYSFDGSQFYSIRQYGFPQERVTSLAEDSEGGIWAATAQPPRSAGNLGGLYRYQSGRVEKIASGSFTSVVSSGPDMVLATTYEDSQAGQFDREGLFQSVYVVSKSGNAWHAAKALDKAAKYLSTDSRGSVLFTCPVGWCELSTRQIEDWVRTDSKAELKPRMTPVPGGIVFQRVLRDRFNCLWFRMEGAAGHACPGEKAQAVPDSVASPDVTSYLGETSDGSILLLGLSSAISLGRPGAFQVARASNGVPGGVQAVLPARDGTIFVANGEGLFRFMYPFRLEYWGQQQGVDAPYSILRMGDEILASNAGIQKLDSSRRSWLPWVSPQQVGSTVHLLPGPQGTVYAASILTGASQYGKDGHLVAQTERGMGGARLAGDGKGNVWLAGTGITKIEAKGNRLALTQLGLDNGVSLDMEYDTENEALWGCQESHVVVRRGSEWRKITRKDGLLEDDCRSIAVLPSGEVWIAYAHLADLTRIRRTSTDSFKVDTFATDSKVHSGDNIFLDSDARGWLWMASNRADYVATPEAAALGNWLRLDGMDGIPSPGGNQNSFFRDDDKSVWFASDNTVVHFKPSEGFATSFPAPPIFISGVSQGSGDTSTRVAPVLAGALGPMKRRGDLTAYVGSMQFDRRNAMHLRYRLMPESTTWTTTDHFELALGRPRWGHHSLEVQARLSSGAWSPVVTQSLDILWPIWFSWPALLFVGVGGTGAGWGTARWIKQSRSRRDLVLPDISAWRMDALSPETEHLIGMVIDGRYEIGHMLSIGGFASVARARDLRKGGELCAIKILRFDATDRAWIRHRFEQEVSALEQLSHPNIVKITGHGTVDTGAPYLVMEFIQGRNLRELLEEGALPRRQAARFIEQIAGALTELHKVSIYHRDLKPENLMVRTDAENEQEIVLIDFSIAIVKSADQTFHGISRVAGTLGYMAPEQVIGYADATTDIHALAKVILEMLSGTCWMDLLPEGTLEMADFVRGYLTREPMGLQDESQQMIASALEFDPGRRPKDVSLFAAPIIRDLASRS